MRRIFSAVILGLAFYSTHALAIPTYVVSGGKLVGINNVTISFYDEFSNPELIYTKSYDLRFVEGSFNSIFGGPDAIDFPYASTPEPDFLHVLAGLIQDTPLGNFDTQPDLIYGCEYSVSCEFITPVAVGQFGDPDNVSTMIYLNRILEIDDHGTSSDINIDQNTLFDARSVYVDWTEVPTPATIWLMVYGLAGLELARRKKEA